MPLDECNCLNGGICNQSQCICPQGFTGSLCERIDLCNSNNCEAPMACIGGKCICPDGGNNCLSACYVNPCLNEGICHNKGTNYYCQCTSEFNGK